MLSLPEKIVFVVFAVTAVYLTFHNFRQTWRVVRRGGGHLHLAALPARLWHALAVLISQRTVFNYRPLSGLFHLTIVWGFLFYFLVNFGDVLEGFMSDYRFLQDTAFAETYRFLADVLSIGVLTGMSYFLIRRFLTPALALRHNDRVVLHPQVAAGGIRRDSAIVGAFMLLHVGGRFLGQTFILAGTGFDAAQPFASAVAGIWSALPHDLIILGEHLSWWLALGLIMAFVPWFPRTKHFHLIMAPLNFLTRPERRSLGAMEPLDLENEEIEQFGAARIEDLSQTQLMDAYACIMCNRCQDVCPAYAAGTRLSPATLEINKRYVIKDHVDLLAMAGSETPDLLTDSVLPADGAWACVACGACVEICPVGNEPMFDILNMRQHLVLMEGDLPDLLASAMTQAERAGDPWGNQRGTRMDWAAGLDVPLMADKQTVDVLYWIGCAGAYDPAGQRTSRAIVQIFRQAGVDFAVLGDEERCHCEWARRGGNEALYYDSALELIAVFNQYEFNLIITQCPHCFNTFKNEYPDFGGHYEVVHHSMYIAKLLTEGRIKTRKVDRRRKKETVTYHDSCFLGRYNGEYEGPRAMLESVGNLEVVEMDRNHNRSLCCGGGGAQVWMETHQDAPVNITRFEEAVSTGATTIGVACPFCTIMLDSAAQTKGIEDVNVRDIAEIVAEAL